MRLRLTSVVMPITDFEHPAHQRAERQERETVSVN
jgi:hypothetical protein